MTVTHDTHPRHRALSIRRRDDRKYLLADIQRANTVTRHRKVAKWLVGNQWRAEMQFDPKVGDEGWFCRFYDAEGNLRGVSVGGHISPTYALIDGLDRIDSGQMGTLSAVVLP